MSGTPHRAMAKRPADSLDTSAAGSPDAKRARINESELDARKEAAKGQQSEAARVQGGVATSGSGNKPTTEVAADDANYVPTAEDLLEEQLRKAYPMPMTEPTPGYKNMYLETVDRKKLDFDFEKMCSVTLETRNVYACLVCGRFLRGRNHTTQSYFHSLEHDHHVFINLETKRIYVLPEGYEVLDSSFTDIKIAVDPRPTAAEVAELDTRPRRPHDLWNRPFVPGFLGMNNLKATDFFNVVVQALAHVAPLRDYFLLRDMAKQPQLAQRFSLLVRKLWNPRSFRSHVSPHELMQEVTTQSGKRYELTKQSDPADFLIWFANHLHKSVGGDPRKPGSSIVFRTFQGRLKIESQEITARADQNDRLRFEDADVKTEVSPFLILPLDLPPKPLFLDALEANVIPQVALSTILSKYDGLHAQERRTQRIRCRLMHPLPPYVMFHIKRFSSNKFLAERNPTIVTFGADGLDLAPFTEPNPRQHPVGEPVLYDLVANVVHEAVKQRDDSVFGEQELKVWRVQLRDRAHDEWITIQDLYVNQDRVETLFTKESYIQIWARRQPTKATKPAKPATPATPKKPEEPVESKKPEEPVESKKSEEPVESKKSEDSVKSKKPEDSVTPKGSEEPAKLEELAKSKQSEEPAKSEDSVKSKEPGEPANPEELAKSEELAKPEELAKSEESAKSGELAKSEKSEKSEEAVKSEKPDKADKTEAPKAA